MSIYTHTGGHTMFKKTIINAIYSFLHEFAKAKAASQLARTGRYKEAQAVMASK